MRLNTKIFSSVSTKSFVLGFIIITAVVAFVFTGFGRLNPTGLFGLDPNTAAQVGSEKIEMQQFAAIISSQLNQDTPPEQRKMLARQLIQRMIQEKVLAEEAKNLGWNVSDVEMATLIRSIPQFQNPKTQQFDMQAFKNYIASQQMSELSFYSFLKQQLEIQKFNNLLYLPTPISTNIAEIQNKINSTEFKLQYALITLPDAILKQKVLEESQKYVNDKNNLNNLTQLYNNSKNQFSQKAQVKALTILISHKDAQRAQGEALKRTPTEAKKLIEEIQAQLAKGADFAKLAKDKNDDVNAKNNGGNIGFIDESNMDPKSVSAALSLTAQKPLSTIVETPFGFRIFKFVEGKPAITKSFDDVKLQLAEQLIGSDIRQKLEANLLKEVNETLSAKNIAKLNTILTENKITWQYLSKQYKVSESFISELGVADNLAQNIFTLKNPGDLIQKVLDFGTKKAIVKLVVKTSPTNSKDEIEALKKQMTGMNSQEFATKTQKYILSSYEKSDKIKINPALLN
ncbi:peptidylprolyl isomerase [Pigmentibacter ruber]|uniref:peptidylprolyl isomerase n=1 Tax=Pigmentibacter ruber TaxID=2683196 RepID=UPI00131B5018|nr:peptidylprolyl isomerase [Pigmentibacter ruber]